MSVIRTLSFKSKIDTSGFDAGVRQLSASTDSISRDIGDKLSGLKFDAPKMGEGAASGGGLDQAGASLVRLGPQIRAALESALTPLTQIGQNLSKQLDSHLKFQRLEASIKEIREFWAGNLDAMGNQAGAFRKRVQRLFGQGLLGSGARMPDLGSLKVPKLDFGPGTRSVTAFRGATQAASRSMKMLGFEVAAALGFVGIAFKVATEAISFFTSGIKGASDLNETLSKTDAILGTASTGVKAFADEMASKFGLIKGQTLDIASGIAGMGKGLGGLRGEKLEKFTTDLTKLAADLSSFKNISFADAGKAIQVGLSGEQSDQLKQLGVVMTEDAVKSYAYANAIARVGSELTNQQKVMARSGLIQKALKDASGDLEKTAGGAANQYRQFTGTVANLGTSIGAVMLPALTKGLELLNGFGSAAYKAFEGSKGTFEGFIAGIGTGIDFAIAAFHNWDATVEVFRLTMYQGVMNAIELLANFGDNAGTIGEYLADNWVNLILDGFNAIGTGIINLGKNFFAFGEAIGRWLKNPTAGFHVDWMPLLDGFEATADKLPDLIKPVLTDMSKQISDAGKPIFDEVEKKAAAARAKLGAAPLVDAPVDPDADAAGKKKKGQGFDLKLAGAVDANSTAGYSAIVNALGAGGGSKGLEENSKKQVDLLGALVRNTKPKNLPALPEKADPFQFI